MKRPLTVLLFLTIAGVAASAQGPAQKYRAPRPTTGHPDLQGVWNFTSGVPMQRPAAFATKKMFTREEFEARRNMVRTALSSLGKIAPVEDVGLDWLEGKLYVDDLRTSLITYPDNGRLPATLDGVRRMPNIEDLIGLFADSKTGPPPQLGALIAAFSGGKKDSYKDFMPSERCLLDMDVPLTPQIDGNYVQIIQGPDSIALITDFARRTIALDGRAVPGKTIKTWTGVSRGRWEGETLVVETSNFANQPPSFAGIGNAGEKVVTERFTRTGANVIDYAAAVVDPKTFKDRVEFSFPMALVEDGHIYESTCHEHNYSMRNALSAARMADQAKPAK